MEQRGIYIYLSSCMDGYKVPPGTVSVICILAGRYYISFFMSTI